MCSLVESNLLLEKSRSYEHIGNVKVKTKQKKVTSEKKIILRFKEYCYLIVLAKKRNHT